MVVGPLVVVPVPSGVVAAVAQPLAKKSPVPKKKKRMWSWKKVVVALVHLPWGVEATAHKMA